MVNRKLSEKDLDVAVLFILKNYGSMDTSKLKDKLFQMINPGGTNLDPLKNRSDTKFDQIVRNIVSHADVKGNLINDGYVSYNNTTRVLSITNVGEFYLEGCLEKSIIDLLE